MSGPVFLRFLQRRVFRCPYTVRMCSQHDDDVFECACGFRHHGEDPKHECELTRAWDALEAAGLGESGVT